MSMNMEHRWNRRSELSLDVIVHGRDGSVLTGRTRNVSPSGMFIQFANPVDSITKVVEIEVSQHTRLPCWVVHAEREGMGVMFLSVGEDEECILDQLLSANSEEKDDKDAA